MPLIARKPTADEFAVWKAASVDEYAAEKTQAGNWPAEDAPRLAAAAFDSLLANGVDTPGHALLRLVLAESGSPAGWLWVGPSRDTPGDAWLFDISIEPALRRHGLGREAMSLAEKTARELGHSRLGLHVFGHNLAARRLYESCGYTLTNLNFAKSLV